MTGLHIAHLEAYKRIEKNEAPLLLLYMHFWGKPFNGCYWKRRYEHCWSGDLSRPDLRQHRPEGEAVAVKSLLVAEEHRNKLFICQARLFLCDDCFHFCLQQQHRLISWASLCSLQIPTTQAPSAGLNGGFVFSMAWMCFLRGIGWLIIAALSHGFQYFESPASNTQQNIFFCIFEIRISGSQWKCCLCKQPRYY